MTRHATTSAQMAEGRRLAGQHADASNNGNEATSLGPLGKHEHLTQAPLRFSLASLHTSTSPLLQLPSCELSLDKPGPELWGVASLGGYELRAQPRQAWSRA